MKKEKMKEENEIDTNDKFNLFSLSEKILKKYNVKDSLYKRINMYKYIKKQVKKNEKNKEIEKK